LAVEQENASKLGEKIPHNPCVKATIVEPGEGFKKNLQSLGEEG